MKEKENTFCRCLYYSANALSRLVTKMAEEEFAVTGLSPSYAFIMISLNKAEQGLSPTELAEIMMLNPSTITRLVEKLQNKRLVSKSSDGRQVLITTTQAGKDLNGKIVDAWNNYYKRYSEILGREEGHELTRHIYEAAKKIEESLTKNH